MIRTIERKLDEGVNEEMKAMAIMLREFARRIEEGEVTGIALSFVDYVPDGEGGFKNNIGTSYAVQYGTMNLCGGIAKLKHLFLEDLCDE